MKSFLYPFFEYVHPRDMIVLAISGGVDSMVLLDLVRKAHSKDYMIVAHFDHMLRGADSDMDRELVADICKRYDITFEFTRQDIGAIQKSEKGSLEAIARRERYAFLDRIQEKYAAKYILTAHHTDDQVETFLMNLLKGGKHQGLSAMPVLSQSLFRPLLNTQKSDLIEYAEENAISFREDATNADTTYDRNKIRNQVIPVLSQINPSFHKTIGKLVTHMQDISGFIDGSVEKWLHLHSIPDGDGFYRADFLAEDMFFRREILAYIYRRGHSGSTQGLSAGLLAEMMRYIEHAEGSTEKSMGILLFSRKQDHILYENNKF